MLIYYILVIYIFAIGFFMKNGKLSKKNGIVLTTLAFILITGLRHNDVGSDTTVYYLGFKGIGSMSMQATIGEHRDIGFFAFEWIVHKFTDRFEVFTALIAIIFYVPIGRLIYKYSYDPTLSWLILMAFNFFQFSMTGIRQTAAFGFALTAILEMMEEKPKRFKVILWFLLAISMHRSCLMSLFIIPIYMYSMKATENIRTLSLMLIPLAFVFRTRLVNIVNSLSTQVGYEEELEITNEGGGFTTYLVYMMITVLGFFVYESYVKRDEKNAPFDFAMLTAATATQSMVMVNSVLFRVVWYFAIWLIIYIPRLKSYIAEDKMFSNVIVYGCALFMFFGITIGSATTGDYKFFFQ